MTLDTAIAAALRDASASADVEPVLAEARTAHAAAEREIESARADAFSPMATPEAVRAGRQAMADAEFRRDRLTIAVGALLDRVRHLKERERQAAESAERDAAVAERDALAAVIGDEMPALTRRYAELVRELEASDRRLSGCGVAETAEVVARGYPSNGQWPLGGGPVMRLRDARLPLFRQHGVAWAFDPIRGTATWPGAEA